METKSAVFGGAAVLLAGGLAFGLVATANAENAPAPIVTTSVAPSAAPTPEVVVTTPAPEPIISTPVVEPVPVAPAPVVAEPAPVVVAPVPVAPVYAPPASGDLPTLWTPATAAPASPGAPPNPQPPGEGFLK